MTVLYELALYVERLLLSMLLAVWKIKLPTHGERSFVSLCVGESDVVAPSHGIDVQPKQAFSPPLELSSYLVSG